MSDKKLPARRYSDDEIARLLQRATELAHEPRPREAEGMTLVELESIAREAGIDPRLLQRAATELDREPERKGLGPLLAGDTINLVIERSFDGELAVSDLEGLVPMINSAADTTGNVALVGKTLNFNGGGQQSSRSVQILVSSRAGKTQVRLEERYGQLAGGLFGGILGGGGGGVGIAAGAGIGGSTGSIALGLGIPLLVVGGCYALARTIFRSVVRKRRKKLTDLVNQIAAVVEESTRRLPPEAEDPRALPASDAD